jgi:O-antigen biosynthesis protein
MMKILKKNTKTITTNKQTLNGHIDTFNGFNLTGWVSDNEKPESIEFQILKEGKLLTEVKADQFRQDLLDAGIHFGKHGFDINLSFGEYAATDKIVFIEKISGQEFTLNNQNKITEFFYMGASEKKLSKLLKELSLFNCDYYSKTHKQNLSDLELDPYTHFLKQGFEENREFSKYSNTQYLKSCLGIGNETFDYFLNNYQKLDFSISPFFDVIFYKHQLKEKGVECKTEYFSHYLDCGYKLGLLPSAFFDPLLLKRAGFPFGKAEVIDWVVNLYRGSDPKNCPDVSRFYNESNYEYKHQTRRHGWLSGIEHYFRDGILNKEISVHPLFFNEVYLKTVGHYSPLPGCLYLARYLQLPKPKNMLTNGVADLSIIILNWNKSVLTLQCVTTIMATMENSDLTYEVVIVDNGSQSSDYLNLVETLGNKCKIIRNAINKFYGEANNIGVESSIGQKILFLNNDAFVTETTITEMMQLINITEVGGVGAKLLFPNGSLQEAGGKVSACGQVTQVGKGLENHENMYTEIRAVDYCSAACLLMDKKFFLDIGGFDYLYEPAYFEDTDLCTKIKLNGKKVLLQPNAITYHIENLTSRDPALNFQFFDNIKANRIKFVARWHNFLEGNQSYEESLNAIGLRPFKWLVGDRNKSNKKAIVYSPYNLTPGGGERYILTLATVLNTMGYDTYFSTPDNLSQTRLRNLGRDLGIDLDSIKPLNWNAALSITDIDVQVTMGNEVLPPVPGIAKHNIYHCQFPFDMNGDLVANNQIYLNSYSVVMVNSIFTQQNYLKRLAQIQSNPIDVKVVYPPCPLIGISESELVNKKPWILNVARFFTGGHQKKQHVAIDAFKELIDKNPNLVNQGVELHLAGSLGTVEEHRDYVEGLVEQSKGYPIRFHLNISNTELKKLYKESLIYWHFTGWGEDLEHNPEFFEHFGISVIEAISSGVVPILPDLAGPAESLKIIGQSTVFKEMNGIIEATLNLIFQQKDKELYKTILTLKEKANYFSEEHFFGVAQSAIKTVVEGK